MAVDLHELPYGSIVAAGQVVAVRFFTGPAPWSVTGTQARYSVGHLLGMSQDWVVLRRGPAVADEVDPIDLDLP